MNNMMETQGMSGEVMQETETMKMTAGNRRKLKGFKLFCREEEGMGTVEIILIIVVLVGLVMVFKDQITDIVDKLFDKITKQTNKI